MSNVIQHTDDYKGPPPYFAIRRASEIIPRTMEWLWDRYIPRGEVTMLSGEPGTGKSTLICEIAAAMATGRLLPGQELPDGQEQLEPRGVWLMNSEDTADTTIVWRLGNQGADMSRVWITDVRKEINLIGLAAIREMIEQHDLGLVVIDTLTTWMGGHLDMNSANQVMEFMNGLVDIAKQTGCAIVTVRHNRKAQDFGPKLHHGLGSIGFTGAVRSELRVDKTNNGMVTLEKIKGNVGKPPPILLYTMEEQHDPKVNPHGVLVWKGKLEPANDTQGGSGKATALAVATAWLSDQLKNGGRPVGELMQAAAEMDISEKSLRRAKSALGVESHRKAEAWYWQFPEKVAKVAK